MNVFVKLISRINLRKRHQGRSAHSSKELTTHVSGIPHEELFHRMIRLERKRTERSGRDFLLMLLNANGGYEERQEHEIMAKVLDAISGATRETDTIGWYRNESTIGVILTDIDEEKERVKLAIQNNIYRAIGRNLKQDKIDKIHISFHEFPEHYDQETTQPVSDATLYPDVAGQETRRRYSLLLKRMLDVVGSAMGLAMLAPVLMIIAALIKLSSRGPVLVKQERIGQLGESFTFLKFRSMYVNSDQTIHLEYVKKLIAGKREDGGVDRSGGGRDSFYKMTHDPRVTRIGKVLRRSSLDELPQLLNVLKGEMSLVGPRPPLPYEYEAYEIWHRCRLVEVKPGITGLWQVKGRSRTTFDDMVRLDMKYIREWSLWLDVKILLQTPWAVLSGRGAY